MPRSWRPRMWEIIHLAKQDFLALLQQPSPPAGDVCSAKCSSAIWKRSSSSKRRNKLNRMTDFRGHWRVWKGPMSC